MQIVDRIISIPSTSARAGLHSEAGDYLRPNTLEFTEEYCKQDADFGGEHASFLKMSIRMPTKELLRRQHKLQLFWRVPREAQLQR
jgi:hypothetical protein